MRCTCRSNRICHGSCSLVTFAFATAAPDTWLQVSLDVRQRADSHPVIGLSSAFWIEFRRKTKISPLDWMQIIAIITKSSPDGPTGSLAPFRLWPGGFFLPYE